MGNYRYQAEQKACQLSTDFGRDYACKVFSLTAEELEALVGRFVRGNRKGMLRGSISWLKVTRGGWVKTGAYDFDENRGSGFVVKPGLTYGHSLFNGNGEQIKGPGPRADDATMIREEMRRRGMMKPAEPIEQRVSHTPSLQLMPHDLPGTAPYLFIGQEAIATLIYENGRHGEVARTMEYMAFVGA